MSKRSRITVSLPTKLLYKFDEVLNGRSYRSRSNGIQHAMKDYIKHYESMNEIKGEHIGTISIIYDHQHSGLMENISYLQNEYHVCINSVMHVHATNNQSLEVIVVKGDMKYIKNLSNKIMGVNGVKEVKLTTTLLYSL